jgi:hypothetical protein
MENSVMTTPVVFNCVPSVANYVRGDLFQNFIVGPIGSTKTTGSLMKLMCEASRVAAGTDGIRRSRYAIVRNTRQQLFDSTIKDFLKWYPDGQAGTWLKTDMTFKIKMHNIECEVMFRGLDDANDVRRLLSLQLTGAFMDEFREINPDIFNALTGRLGRYPDGMLVPHRPSWGKDSKGNPIQGCVDDHGKSMKRIWGSTNPPDMDTFWHEYLTNFDPTRVQVDIQPGGLSQEADWIHLLPENYYEDLMVGKSQEWINVYVHGKWGESLSGRPVFRAFNMDTHVAKESVRAMRTEARPLIIGFDFGLNPSAVVCQIDMFGRLLVLAAESAEGMGVTRFIAEILRPLLTSRFPGLPCIVIGDPAGAQRAQTDERSCFDILRNHGFKVMPAHTNAIVARIAAVDAYLTRQVEGKPAMIIDPGAKKLINAMRGGYRYKIKKTSGEMEDTPEKNVHSHVADAFQYACLHADGGLRGIAWGTGRRPVKHVSSAGWT